MKKLIILSLLLYVAVANAKDNLVASCVMNLDNTISAKTCSNFDLENERERLFIDGMCKMAGGRPSKELCTEEGIEATCTVVDSVTDELVDSYYYDFSNNQEINAERDTCEKSMKGEFTLSDKK